jgi:hypothetical protein
VRGLCLVRNGVCIRKSRLFNHYRH